MNLRHARLLRRLAVISAGVALLLVPTAAQADPAFYASPLFGISTTPNGGLYVADAGQGIVDADSGALIASLPGINDVVPIGQAEMLAVTTVDQFTDAGVNRVTRDRVQPIADTVAFEEEIDPAGDGADEGSNPFDLARLPGHSALIADAAGNDLLVVDEKGNLDWVASFPARTDVTCPPGFCAGTVPFPVQAVPTSVAIGPDGAYYVGELTGFPFTPGFSRIWRIEPGTRHAACGTSPACSLIVDDLTAIIDLQFGPDGRLYLAQLDDAGVGALEGGSLTGGSIRACNVTTGGCEVVASGIPMLTAIAFRGSSIWHTVWSLVPEAAPPPFSADVVPLTP